MNILIVGNILKDVYISLDSRTNSFEQDKNSTDWLDLSFNASSHHFFNRLSTFGGATITQEVLQNLDQSAHITNQDAPVEIYRYILASDNGVTYFTPNSDPFTVFEANQVYDCIYIDPSAKIDSKTASAISDYLDSSPATRLAIYLSRPIREPLLTLVNKANLIFLENNRGRAEDSDALTTADLPEKKTIHISESSIEYGRFKQKISIDRIDNITHLSTFTIISATILGCFALGKTIQESFKYARLNAENSTISSTLSLTELDNLALARADEDDLELIAASLVYPRKGILAADESGGSIEKKFAQLDIPDTFENRHDYRNLFFTTPDLEKYVNGVILFDETARDHADNGESYPEYLISRRIVPGIKVDQGLEPFPDSTETYTKGLNGLSARLREYYQMGLRFAKWRAAFNLTLDSDGNVITPTTQAIEENCRILAEYAKSCQSAGIVPIVEPELVYDGNYPIDKSMSTTGKILDILFHTLDDYNINLRACILKTNMVLAGKKYSEQSTPAEVGKATAEVLKNHVPEDLAGVVFLSGGQTVEQATDNLREIIKNGPFPWPVTFSFARALQDPALFTWKGDNTNSEAAKKAFKERLEANTSVL